MAPRKRRSLLKAIIFRFYVKLRGAYIYIKMNIYIYIYIYILYSWWYPFTFGETGPLLADFWISFWWSWCDHISFKRHRSQRLDHDLYHQIQKGQLLFLFSLWRKQIQAFAWFRLSIPGDFSGEVGIFFGVTGNWYHLQQNPSETLATHDVNTEEMKADSKQVIEDVYVGDSGSLMMAVMSSCWWVIRSPWGYTLPKFNSEFTPEKLPSQ